MKATLFGLLSLVAVTVPAGVRAENCTATYRSAFSQLNPSSGPSQGSADAEIERLFGPRPMKCEEGAYKNFLELFEAFARESIRSGQPTKRGKVTVVWPASQDWKPGEVDLVFWDHDILAEAGADLFGR